MIHRCDAGPEIGTGHFFRQLALAEEARDRGREPLLLVSGLTEKLAEHARAAGVAADEVVGSVGGEKDARELAGRLDIHSGGAAVVVDGYRFGPDYYRRLSDHADCVVAVDDTGEQSFPVDLLVNVNPQAGRLEYPEAELCLRGPRYALLREQFVEARRRLEEQGGPPIPAEVDRVLVAYGGADIGRMTARSLRALNDADFRGRIDVVLGPATPRTSTIEQRAERSDAEVRLHRNVSRLAPLFAEQHLALCAAGNMTWELVCLGVPMVQTVVADNQREIATSLEEAGIALRAGVERTLRTKDLADLFLRLARDRGRRRRMSRRGMKLVDGEGAGRILDQLELLLAD